MENDNDKELMDSLNEPAPKTETPAATPAAAPAAVPGAEPAPAAPATPAKAKLNADFWSYAELDEPDEAAPDRPEPTSPGLTKKAIQTGARTAVGVIDFAQGMVFRPLVNYQFKKIANKRFGADLDRALDLVDGDTPNDERERVLKSKLNRLIKSRDKKYESVPFNSDEEKDMQVAMEMYFETKQITMSPDVLLYANLFGTLGKRLVDVMVWD